MRIALHKAGNLRHLQRRLAHRLHAEKIFQCGSSGQTRNGEGRRRNRALRRGPNLRILDAGFRLLGRGRRILRRAEVLPAEPDSPLEEAEDSAAWSVDSARPHSVALLVASTNRCSCLRWWRAPSTFHQGQCSISAASGNRTHPWNGKPGNRPEPKVPSCLSADRAKRN
jgi:hypothetical protein